MKYILILSLLLSFSTSHAQTCPYVQPINKQQSAPCDGFFFSDQAEKDASNAKLDAELHKSVNDVLVKKIDLLNQDNALLERRLNLYIQQSERLSDSLSKKETNEGLYRFLYFSLGVVVTGVIAANVHK